MAEVYLIATLEKVDAAGKKKPLKDSEREYYIGAGQWTKNPMSARMHKPEALAKTMERAGKADMYPGRVCGLIAGEQKFVVTVVITPEVLAEKEKQRLEELKAAKKEAALAKLSKEEKELLGIA